MAKLGCCIICHPRDWFRCTLFHYNRTAYCRPTFRETAGDRYSRSNSVDSQYSWRRILQLRTFRHVDQNIKP